MSKYEAVIVVPRSGRTFDNFMHKLDDDKIADSSPDLSILANAVSEAKKHKSTDAPIAKKHLDSLDPDLQKHLSLFVDRKRDLRPYRIGFMGMDYHIGDVNCRIEGDEPHNCSSLVSLGEADIAIAGWDELLNVQQTVLSDQSVTKWGMYNYNIPNECKVKIAGSAMLTRWNSTIKRDVQDFVGFFLISKMKPEGHSDKKYPQDYIKRLEDSGASVFVKGRYVDIVKRAYPRLVVEAVYDVEDAVVASPLGSVGLEIVQSGSTLKRKGLILLGEPLFLSESLYVVDFYKYTFGVRSKGDNSGLKKVVNSLSPVDFFDESRMEQFCFWYIALEKNIGENWINKPNIEDMFCSNYEVENGLRPVRLQTRYWKPSDEYKATEAKKYAIEKRARLANRYNILFKEFN